MRLFNALRHRAIRLLWGGQALSAVGDEIYRVALTWLAVGLIGERAGYLASAQSASLLVVALLSGRWADSWDRRRTMVRVDALRAAVALVPVAAYYAGRGGLPALALAAVTLSGLGAFFDPALQATLPEVAPDVETLQAATGLMGTTVRLARAIGPAVVGVLGVAVPTIHFFTLDAATFVVSALSVRALGPSPAAAPDAPVRPRGLRAVLRRARGDALLRDVMLSRAAVSGLWALAYGLAFPLRVRELSPSGVAGFGAMVAAYGVGNVAGALFVGNLLRTRPARILYSGYSVMGAGFVAMGLARGLPGLAAASVVAGFGGPVNDVPFYDLAQARWSPDELPAVFRLRMAAETGAAMVVMSLSPFLLSAYRPAAVLAACGAAFAALGATGLAIRAERDA